MLSSQDFGILSDNELSNELLIGIGGISVSGYILAAPGLGLLKEVLPSNVAARVSAGTPINVIFNLSVIASTASSTLSFGPPTITKASMPMTRSNFFQIGRASCRERV